MDWKEKLEQLKRNFVGLEKKPISGTVPAPADNVLKLTPERVYFCLGLDFGTSSTKAVVKMQTVARAYAVPFFPGIASEDQPYLAPTCLWVGERGAVGFVASGGGGWVEELKVRLMEKPWERAPSWLGASISARPSGLATAYVALTIREVMGWFDKHVKPTLGTVDIHWAFNLGIPARDFDAIEIKEAFHAVARAGWHIAVEGGAVTLDRAEKTVDDARANSFSPNGIDKEAVNVVPEVAAGVTAYVRSPQRQPGAHLFVDVGATTLDTSLFLLGEKEEGFNYVFLAADVDSNLGALRLHNHRATQLGQLALAKFAASNPLKPIPKTVQDCVPESAELEKIDADFTSRCLNSIGSVIARAKRKAPQDMSVPDEGHFKTRVDVGAIRVLRSGGGMHLPLYYEAIDEVGVRVAPGGKLGLRVKPLRSIDLRTPVGLDAPGLEDSDWSRMAIAYGLSFPIDDIGTFVPPSKVSDPESPRHKDDGDNFISKDQV